MQTSNPNLKSIASIYPDHVWIEVDKCEASSIGQIELNQFCLNQISVYLQHQLGLTIKESAPSHSNINQFIWNLVNGFVLEVEGVRIVFIPSQDIDIAGFEVSKEWVDLPHWFADYYVPIQVDLEHDYLRLWGFISHKSLKSQAHFDATIRSYEVDGTNLINELDALWMSCDLQSVGELTPQRGEIPPLTQLSPAEVTIWIDRLKTHQSVFSPRLNLSFEQWGAILDNSQYLQMYQKAIASKTIELKTSNLITTIGDWFSGLIDRSWQLVKDPTEFLPAPGLMKANVAETEIHCIKDLEPIFAEHKLGLLVSATVLPDGHYQVVHRVCSTSPQHYLPPNINLTLLSEQGEILYQVQSDNNGRDSYIQIHFTASRGDQFSLCVGLLDRSIEEAFTI